LSELDINPEIVCHVIEKAREFQAKESVVLPDSPSGSAEDWAMQALASHGDDLSYQEVRLLIEDLEPDQQISLVALMWVGRGVYDQQEWEEALTEARDQWNGRTAECLLATPLVADYLEEGLAQFGYSCDEL